VLLDNSKSKEILGIDYKIPIQNSMVEMAYSLLEQNVFRNKKKDQVTVEQFKGFLMQYFNKYAKDGKLDAENGYLFSNDCFKFRNPGVDLPKEIFEVEWAKVEKDENGLCDFGQVHAKASVDADNDKIIRYD
jgi:hypothetical protein